MKKVFMLAALLAFSLVNAKEIEIKLLNKGADGAMPFEPGYVYAQPGDTITFVAVDAGHDAKSVVIPDGAQHFETKIMKKGSTLSFKLDKEGIYVYQCTPHLPMGMVGIVQVGKAVNMDKINDSIFKPAKAKERLAKYISQIQK
ncbi:pseudoazurin [Campylobacter troglodytis]|uniref:pseudoazurin n=1 Tax=Campylobacter troglodytis TaxID=654363 RepID=UPI00115BAAC5|nr:pseudoazurin [Campylobacter troglodytis]TQR59577.1 pseudoazurin [Campylobacter troglodytis]